MALRTCKCLLTVKTEMRYALMTVNKSKIYLGIFMYVRLLFKEESNNKIIMTLNLTGSFFIKRNSHSSSDVV